MGAESTGSVVHTHPRASPVGTTLPRAPYPTPSNLPPSHSRQLILELFAQGPAMEMLQLHLDCRLPHFPVPLTSMGFTIMVSAESSQKRSGSLGSLEASGGPPAPDTRR